jgi:hypothetical protein
MPGTSPTGRASTDKAGRFPAAVVALEAAGFLTIVALIWIDELWDLPYYLFGASPTPFRPAEAIAESGLVVLMGAAIIVASIRILRRVAYLESMIVLCAWCRRVRMDDSWVSIEEFLHVHRRTTSHGICPDCDVRLNEEGMEIGDDG